MKFSRQNTLSTDKRYRTKASKSPTKSLRNKHTPPEVFKVKFYFICVYVYVPLKVTDTVAEFTALANIIHLFKCHSSSYLCRVQTVFSHFPNEINTIWSSQINQAGFASEMLHVMCEAMWRTCNVTQTCPSETKGLMWRKWQSGDFRHGTFVVLVTTYRRRLRLSSGIKMSWSGWRKTYPGFRENVTARVQRRSKHERLSSV